jgi:serine/threonine protein kinase
MSSTIRYCPNCGEECSWDHRFCQRCRAELQPVTESRKGQTPRSIGSLDFTSTELELVADFLPGKVTPTPADFTQTELGFPTNLLLLNRYRIQRQLGMGGMGRVYLAMDEKLENPVAIKVLREVLMRDPGSVKRLIAEAKNSIKLAHPNVVRVHNFEDGESVKFLVMEYVEGATLADRIAKEGEALGAGNAPYRH